MKPFHVAVLGMGRWGTTWCRILADEPDASVVAVAAGRNAPQLRAAVAFPVFDDFAAALETPGLDAAIVTLPVPLHASAVSAASERGIAVLCEKPLVATAEELAEVTRAAGAARRPIRVGQNYRSRHWAGLVREHLHTIGDLRHVSVDFAQPEFVGGGRESMRHPLLADMSIHHLDLLRHLTGREARVRAARSARLTDARYLGDTDLDAVLELDGGVTATYRATWAARGRTTPWDGDWVFAGTLGELRVTNLVIEIETSRDTLRIPTRPPRDDDDLRAVWRTFASALAGDENAGVTVADNARSLSLVFDIARAAGITDPGRPV